MSYIKIIHPDSGEELLLFNSGKSYMDVFPIEMKQRSVIPEDNDALKKLKSNMNRLKSLQQELETYHEKLTLHQSVSNPITKPEQSGGGLQTAKNKVILFFLIYGFIFSMLYIVYTLFFKSAPMI